MNSLLLLIICIAILVAGYIFYGGWLCKIGRASCRERV